jgi:hypothetical protein
MITTCIFYSCDKDNLVEDLKGETLTYDAFFEKVISSKINIEKEHALYFDYKWNKKTNLITIVSITEREPDFFVLENRDSSTPKPKMAYASYTVECTVGGNTTSTTCDGKISCGSAIAKCLDRGGCATICQNRMAYIPQYKTFYLLPND